MRQQLPAVVENTVEERELVSAQTWRPVIGKTEKPRARGFSAQAV
jgi:hypothetical protein